MDPQKGRTLKNQVISTMDDLSSLRSNVCKEFVIIWATVMYNVK